MESREVSERKVRKCSEEKYAHDVQIRKERVSGNFRLGTYHQTNITRPFQCSRSTPTTTSSTQASMASEPDSSTKLSLLTLPPEIRNHIFTLAVVDITSLIATIHNRNLRTHAYPGPPSLARSCRQLRKETLPIFYGANTFFSVASIETCGSGPMMRQTTLPTQPEISRESYWKTNGLKPTR
jgi:hypothetical protein